MMQVLITYKDGKTLRSNVLLSMTLESFMSVHNSSSNLVVSCEILGVTHDV